MAWQATATSHVWHDPETGRYCCEDEANLFFGDYATYDEAVTALNQYCAWLHSTCNETKE